MARLAERYKTEIAPELKDRLKIENVMAIPKLKSIVVSMGVGAALADKRRLPAAVEELGKITGQKPVICKARKSVSNFKLRQGYEIGCKVTLRGSRMYEFLDRLINVAVPRMRDFRGLNPTSFDGRGNYSMGVAEQSIFPEIDLAKVEFRQGMNITMVTSARNDQQARELLTLLGMPFRQTQESKN